MGDVSECVGSLTLFVGPNFSGRTASAREFAGLPMISPSVNDGGGNIGKSGGSRPPNLLHGAFLGEDPGATISGLAASVSGEIAIQSFGGRAPADLPEGQVYAFLRNQNLLDRSPFTLSGGEQTLVAVNAILAAQRDKISIDVALEQLSPIALKAVLEDLRRSAATGTKIAIIDNRPDLESQFAHAPQIRQFRQHQNVPKLAIGKLTPRAPAPSVQLKNLSFRYGSGPWVFRNLNFDLPSGQVIHLRGDNGAGKSTLSKLLSGLLRPSSGRIFVGRKRPNLFGHPGSIFAYNFQNPDHQLFRTSVVRELLSASQRTGRSRSQYVDKLIDAFGLEGFRASHPLDLPFVLRKRLAVAVTVAMERPWMIFDEPTLGQDQQSALEIAQLLQSLAIHGNGVIFISHSATIPSLIPCTEILLREGGSRGGKELAGD